MSSQFVTTLPVGGYNIYGTPNALLNEVLIHPTYETIAVAGYMSIHSTIDIYGYDPAMVLFDPNGNMINAQRLSMMDTTIPGASFPRGTVAYRSVAGLTPASNFFFGTFNGSAYANVNPGLFASYDPQTLNVVSSICIEQGNGFAASATQGMVTPSGIILDYVYEYPIDYHPVIFPWKGDLPNFSSFSQYKASVSPTLLAANSSLSLMAYKTDSGDAYPNCVAVGQLTSASMTPLFYFTNCTVAQLQPTGGRPTSDGGFILTYLNSLIKLSPSGSVQNAFTFNNPPNGDFTFANYVTTAVQIPGTTDYLVTLWLSNQSNSFNATYFRGANVMALRVSQTGTIVWAAVMNPSYSQQPNLSTCMYGDLAAFTRSDGTSYAVLLSGRNNGEDIIKFNVNSCPGMVGQCPVFKQYPTANLPISPFSAGAQTGGSATIAGPASRNTTYTFAPAKAILSSQPTVPCLASLQTGATYSCLSVNPLTVSLTATASGGALPYTYSWQFGDGSTGTGNPVTHSYSGLGPYTVTITSTDANGQVMSSSFQVSCPGQVIKNNLFFVDCPSYTREQALEFPITDSAGAYTAKNASTPFNEDALYTVYSRHPILSPFLGAVPTFRDYWNDGSDPGGDLPQIKKDLFCWLNPIDTTQPNPIYILNFAMRNSSDSLPYLTNDNHGSFTLRILPETPGEIIGFRSAPYIDKMGSSLESPSDQTQINKTYIKLTSSTGETTTQSNHVLASNPYATLGNPPMESYPGETTGDQILGSSAPSSWEQGTDRLRWLDNKTVQWGVADATESRGLRFYLSGCDYNTMMELAITDFQGDATNRLRGFWMGSSRIYFYGLPGDKIRWYVTRRCGEPNPYVPSYGMTVSALTAAQNSPLTCLSALASGGGGADQPPTVTILSCPASGGPGAKGPLGINVTGIYAQCCGVSLASHCVYVSAWIQGGMAPITVNYTVTGGITLSGSQTYQSTDMPVTWGWGPGGVSGLTAPVTVTASAVDSYGTQVSTTYTSTTFTMPTCGG